MMAKEQFRMWCMPLILQAVIIEAREVQGILDAQRGLLTINFKNGGLDYHIK